MIKITSAIAKNITCPIILSLFTPFPFRISGKLINPYISNDVVGKMIKTSPDIKPKSFQNFTVIIKESNGMICKFIIFLKILLLIIFFVVAGFILKFLKLIF
mgnify:CR=1 FL=1